MNVQLRRLVTVGLVSGSLAISALVGTAAVGAADLENAGDHLTTTTPAVSVRSTTTQPADWDALPVVTAPITIPTDGREDLR